MMDLNSLFSPKIENVNEKKGTLEFYKPTPEKGKGGVYQAIIRFVTWHENPDKSIIDKWTCWMDDPATGKARSIDCPSSVGKPSPIQDMYWKLKNSKSAVDQELSKKFSRSQAIYSIIQVIKDDNDPSLNGKFLIWKFGKKINEKITFEDKPMMGDGINPFNPIEGRAFALVITKVSGFANYDQSNFLGQKGGCPLLWDVEKEGQFTKMELGQKTPNMVKLVQDVYQKGGKYAEMINGIFSRFGHPQVDINLLDEATLSQLAIFAYLIEKSPNLNQCEYKEWDSETFEFVNEVIRTVTNGSIPTQTANVYNHSHQQPQYNAQTAYGTANQVPQQQMAQQPQAQPFVQEINMGNFGNPQAAPSGNVGQFDSNELNSILAGL